MHATPDPSLAADTAPFQRRQIALPGRGPGLLAALSNQPEAEAPDLIFVHANGFNALTYRHVLAPLAPHAGILAIDLRGHGRSTLATEPHTHAWSVYAEDILALLACLPRPPRVLAGHSMGATSSLLAAHKLTARSASAPSAPPSPRLVLFDPPIGPEAAYAGPPPRDYDQPIAQGALRRSNRFASAEAAFAQYKGRGAFRTWPDAILRDYLQDGLRPGPDGAVTLACAPAWEAANFAAFGQSDPYPALRNTDLHIALLRGETGSTCAVPRGMLAPPFCSDVTVPGSTHFLPMEHGDIVVQSLRGALAP